MIQMIDAGVIIDLNTRELFLEYAKAIWKLIELSYRSIGGHKKFRDYDDFINKKLFGRVVVNEVGTVIAFDVYRIMEDGYKGVAAGCDQTDRGKLALQQLIQKRIVDFDLCYWAEVSGAIEHYFKKYNGFPMPNIVANKILGEGKEIDCLEDGAHYRRMIGGSGEKFTKIIYGIKSQKIFEEVLRDINDYGSFVERINKTNESVDDISVDDCVRLIEFIYTAHEEDEFNELIPSWYNALIKCRNCLIKHSDEHNKKIDTYIEYADYLLNCMQLLELHRFEI